MWFLDIQQFTTNIQFASGYKAWFFDAGTTTPRNVYDSYQDAFDQVDGFTTKILDSQGRAPVWINGPTDIYITISTTDYSNPVRTILNLDSSTTNVFDSNGNYLVQYIEVDNSTEYITISNAAGGDGPSIRAAGSATNIPLTINSKGTGALNLGQDVDVSGNLNVDGDATLNGTIIFETTPRYALPPGAYMWYAGTTAPTVYGFLECDGSAISRTTYAELFTVIGTTYGAGDGSTTFNLPSQARRVLVGRGGSGTATLGSTVGSTGGAETHTLTQTEMPAHTHSFSPSTFASQYGAGAVSAGNALGASNTGSTGGGGAHNNMQPSLVGMLCISFGHAA